MTQFRMGSQNIWFAVEDMETLMDNPALALGSAYFYKGNENVNWEKAYREYTGRKPTKSWLDQIKEYSRGRVKARQDRLRKSSKDRKFTGNPNLGLGFNLPR